MNFQLLTIPSSAHTLLSSTRKSLVFMACKISSSRDEVLPKAVSFRSDDETSLSSAKWKWPETDDADSMDESDDLSEENDIFYDSEAGIEPVPPAQAQPQSQHQIPDEEYVICNYTPKNSF